MAYCTVDDLLLGQIKNRLPVTVDPQDYIDLTAEEMDARIGFVYATPINMLDPTLPEYQKNLLKSINRKLATGRIILSLAIGSEDNTLHAYGAHLLKEGEVELAAIANGDVLLSLERVGSDGVTPGADPTATDNLAHVFGPIQRDVFSAQDVFEEVVHHGGDTFWRPGDGVERSQGIRREAGG